LKNSYILPTIYIIGFFGFASQSLIFPVMPLYAAQLGASVSEVGLIVALVAYGNALFMIPFGLLSDRFGRRTFLIAGFVICTLTTLLYTLTTNIVQLSLLRALHGIGLAAQTPTIIATVLDLSPEEQRGKALGWITAATQTGLMAGPIIGGSILNSFGFGTAFISSSIFSLIGLVVLLARLSTIPQRKTVEVNINKSWGWLKQRPLYGGLLTTFAIAMGIGTLGAYIPIYVAGFGITAAGAGLIITLSFASSAMLRVQSGTLSDKVGRKPLMIFGLVLGAAMIALISRFHSLILLGIISFCFGIGIAFVQPSSMALTADLSPKGAKGLASGMFTCAYQIGNAVGPTAMGAVAGISNLETMFLACGSSIAFTLLIIIILFRTG
jgi:MFS family permease